MSDIDRSLRELGRRAAERGARCQLLGDEVRTWTREQKRAWFVGYLSVYHVDVAAAIDDNNLFEDFSLGQAIDARIYKIRSEMAP